MPTQLATVRRRLAALADRRALALAVVVAALLGLAAAGATSGSNFTLPNWSTVLAACPECAVTDGTGAADHIYSGGGSKDIRDISEWGWRSGETLPPKTDLTNVATWVDGGVLYFAAERASANGNAKIGFWFLKTGAAERADGTFAGAHTSDDLLIEADFTTGADRTRGLWAYQWEGMSGYRGRITESMALGGGLWGDCNAAGSFRLCGTVNEAPMTSPLSGRSLVPGQFFQGAVLLSAVWGDELPPCLPGVVAQTRASGTPITAVLKDYVLAGNPACSITVRKVSPEAGVSDSFDFTTTTPEESFSLLAATSDGTVGAANRTILTPLGTGTYTITEAAKTGWILESIACTNTTGSTISTSTGDRSVTVTIEGTSNPVCTFVNRKLPAIRVTKAIVGGPGGFALRIDGTTYTTTATDGTTTGWQWVGVGNHTVSETDGSGPADLSTFTTAIGCTYSPVRTPLSVTGLTGPVRSSSTIALAYGDRADCTITNSAVPTITVTKYVSGSTGDVSGSTGDRFQVLVDGAAAGSPLKHGESVTVEVAAGAAHTVGEAAAGSTDLANYIRATSCLGRAATDGTFTLTSGDVVAGAHLQCTIVNVKKPRIVVEKYSTGRAGTFSFDLSSGASAYARFDLTTASRSGSFYASRNFRLDSTGGSWTVTERNIPFGFVLFDASCATTVEGASANTVYGDAALTQRAGVSGISAGSIVTCTFVNNGPGTTRTQGFWSTHPTVLHNVWRVGPSISEGTSATDGTTYTGFTITWGWNDQKLCTSGDLTTGGYGFENDLTEDQVIAGFWSRISFLTLTNGTKRSELNQARMKLGQQLLAAMLNHALFGSIPMAEIQTAKDAFCAPAANVAGTSAQIAAINLAASRMAGFNEAGDLGAFTPGSRANPRYARSLAATGYALWDYLAN